MNIKEFKEWLDQFPEDAIVEVAIQEASRGYDPYGAVYFHEFKDSEYDYYEYIDFSDNPYVEESMSHYNKKYLRIGYSD